MLPVDEPGEKRRQNMVNKRDCRARSGVWTEQKVSNVAVVSLFTLIVTYQSPHMM